MLEDENKLEAITENLEKEKDFNQNYQIFEKYTNLLIQYITIYKNLEEC